METMSAARVSWVATLTIVTALVFNSWQMAYASSHGVKASLHFVSAPGSVVTIAGRGWAPTAKVAFIARVGTITVGTVLRATRSGTFRVGINKISLCDRPVFEAASTVSDITLSGPALGCPSHANPPTPILAILKGKHQKVNAVKLASAPGRTMTVHVGDVVFIEPPTTSIPYVPHIDTAFLASAGQSAPVGRFCEGASSRCGGTYFWKFLALHRGNTVIELTAICRTSTPPCGAPGYAIKLRILPPV
ncbi:MAG: hypothetical protein NVSMB52_20110 [Chloroflexota bacterium]